jgi:hypothetical protein
MPARCLSRFFNTRGKHIDLENHKVIITKEGQSVPSEAVSAQFVLDSFVDPTGTSLDQDSLSTLSVFISGYLGVGTKIDVPGAFDLGLVVCSLGPRGGSRIIPGGHSANAVQFEDQISVKSSMDPNDWLIG